MIETEPGPRDNQKPKRWIESLPLARGRPVLGALATIAVVAAAWLLRLIMDPLLPSGFPYVTFFPAVIVTSFLFGVRLGSVAAIICGLLAWYFFTTPAHSLVLTNGAGFALAFYVFVVATDLALVHWMQSANHQLAIEREVNRNLAETRELLFRELQHRVSNNLQVVASLLIMQKRQLKDAYAKEALDEAAGRLELIGSISRQLYDPSGAAQSLMPFLNKLCRSVLAASGRDDIEFEMSGAEDLRLLPDAAVPTALIVGEAVSNALEHGFPEGSSGGIKVAIIRSISGDLEVSVHNDGHDLPAGFRIEKSNSLGLRIATTLARGQGGSFQLRPDNGTIATLVLPACLIAPLYPIADT